MTTSGFDSPSGSLHPKIAESLLTPSPCHSTVLPQPSQSGHTICFSPLDHIVTSDDTVDLDYRGNTAIMTSTMQPGNVAMTSANVIEGEWCGWEDRDPIFIRRDFEYEYEDNTLYSDGIHGEANVERGVYSL